MTEYNFPSSQEKPVDPEEVRQLMGTADMLLAGIALDGLDLPGDEPGQTGYRSALFPVAEKGQAQNDRQIQVSENRSATTRQVRIEDTSVAFGRKSDRQFYREFLKVTLSKVIEMAEESGRFSYTFSWKPQLFREGSVMKFAEIESLRGSPRAQDDVEVSAALREYDRLLDPSLTEPTLRPSVLDNFKFRLTQLDLDERQVMHGHLEDFDPSKLLEG